MCTIRWWYWHGCHKPSRIYQKLTAVYHCLRKAGPNLSIAKCHFAVQKVDLLGRAILTKGVEAQKQKINHLQDKVKIPGCKKTLQHYIGFPNFYRNYLPRLAEQLTPFFQLLKQTDVEAKISITLEIMKEFRKTNEVFEQCRPLALRQPLTGGETSPYDRW